MGLSPTISQFLYASSCKGRNEMNPAPYLKVKTSTFFTYSTGPCTSSPSSNIIKGGSGWSEGGGARNIHTSVLRAPCLEGCTIALVNRSTMHISLHSAVLWMLWVIINICQHWRGIEESFSCRTKVKGVEAVVICMTKNCNFFQFVSGCLNLKGI